MKNYLSFNNKKILLLLLLIACSRLPLTTGRGLKRQKSHFCSSLGKKDFSIISEVMFSLDIFVERTQQRLEKLSNDRLA